MSGPVEFILPIVIGVVQTSGFGFVDSSALRSLATQDDHTVIRDDCRATRNPSLARQMFH